MSRVILNDFHLLPTSGHAGISRMTNNIKRKYYWPGMHRDIVTYVTNCKDCQKQKHSNKKIKEEMVITTTACTSLEKIFLDIVGPLEVDSCGYKYILTLQCELSKFVEAYPLADKSADTVARTFVENYVLRYGVPKEIATDCGTEFMNSTLENVCKLLKVSKINSTAYHHESIGSLENWHKHLGSYLRIQTKNQGINWSTWIPYWCFAYNTSVHTSTKYTPYELVFGKCCRIPSNLSEEVEPLYVYDDYPMELKYRLQKCNVEARNNLIACKLARKNKTDLNSNTITYSSSDYVLEKNENRNKLSEVFKGPYAVVRDLGVNVEIMKNGKPCIVHKNRTKMFKA